MEQLTACLAFVLACGLRKSSALDTLRLSVAVSIRGKSPIVDLLARASLL